MKNARTQQVIIIACSVILFVLLFIANKKPIKSAEDPAVNGKSTQVLDLKVYLDALVSKFSEEEKKEYRELEKKTADTTGINEMLNFFSDKRMPLASCYYFEKKATLLNTAEAIFEAGNRCFYAVGFVKDKNEIQSLFATAMNCFNRVLQKKPNYTEAKIQLASCYVESSSDPMKGIGMLKELEKSDSNNVKVQMVLGSFAVKSGQLNKAEQRYQKVLKFKPDYLEAYLFLADVYEKKGDKVKTIETLQRYVDLTPDKDSKNQIERYIKQLQGNESK